MLTAVGALACWARLSHLQALSPARCAGWRPACLSTESRLAPGSGFWPRLEEARWAQSGSALEAEAEAHPCACPPPQPMLFAVLKASKGPHRRCVPLAREGVGLDMKMVLSSPVWVTDF